MTTFNWYGFWADVIVAVHVGYVGFVVFGELAVLCGLALRKRWARNPWFRCIHLAAVLIVGFELLWRIPCPLTTWEFNLRKWAGQDPSGETFVGRCLHEMIFHANVSEWTITMINAAVGLLIVLTFAVFPPRFARGRASKSSANVTRSVTAT